MVPLNFLKFIHFCLLLFFSLTFGSVSVQAWIFEACKEKREREAHLLSHLIQVGEVHVSPARPFVSVSRAGNFVCLPGRHIREPSRTR